MAFRADTLRAWGAVAPVDEAWPPFVRPEPGTRVEIVVCWAADEDLKRRMGRVLPWLIRLAFLWKGVNLAPQALEFVGPASSEEVAQTACLDESYCSFPMTVDRFLPRESVNLSGVRYWKRRLHKLFWLSEPDEVDTLAVVRESELNRLRALEGRLGDLASRIRAAL